LMNEKSLATLGIHLEDALKDTAQSCILTDQATKLRKRVAPH
jgi:hypothetical protein